MLAPAQPFASFAALIGGRRPRGAPALDRPVGCMRGLGGAANRDPDKASDRPWRNLDAERIDLMGVSARSLSSTEKGDDHFRCQPEVGVAYR